MELTKVSDTLTALREQLSKARDGEIVQADECLSSYINDHNDKRAWREKDKQVTRLARAWDKMIDVLATWEDKARSIEASVESFYGD